MLSALATTTRQLHSFSLLSLLCSVYQCSRVVVVVVAAEAVGGPVFRATKVDIRHFADFRFERDLTRL